MKSGKQFFSISHLVQITLVACAAIFIYSIVGIVHPGEAKASTSGCCPAGGQFSPGANGGPSFCVTVNTLTGEVTQTPATCSQPLTPGEAVEARFDFYNYYQGQMQLFRVNYAAELILASMNGMGGTDFRILPVGPDYGENVPPMLAGLSHPFIDNNSIGGGFLGTSLHDSGGTINSGGVSSAGVANTTTSFGFELHDIYDASQVFGLGPNQQLLLGGFFFYNNDRDVFDSGAGGGPAAVNNTNDFTFLGTVAYHIGGLYAIGVAGGNFGPSTLIDNTTGGSGNYSSGGFTGVGTLGYVFSLVDPRTAGYSLGLDVSGHGGYLTNASTSFVDSTGTAYGAADVHSGLVGGQATLRAAFPAWGVMWTPYVGATVDDFAGLSATADIPSGGVTSLYEGETFWGGQAGLGITCANGLSVLFQGFYKESSTVGFGGGTVTLKVPLDLL